MTARVRMKRHPNGVCVAHVIIPTHVGTITVGGFGDFLSDALDVASKVATRITSDPVVSAILPPQATIALQAVKAVAQAANHGPDALKAQLDQYSGPGKVRLVKALHAEATALDNGATPAAAARAATAAAKTVKSDSAAKPAATADNASRGSGLPSFLAQGGGVGGNFITDAFAKLQAQANAKRGVSSDHRSSSLTPSGRKAAQPQRGRPSSYQPNRNHQGRGDQDRDAHRMANQAPDQDPDDYEDGSDAPADNTPPQAQPYQYADDQYTEQPYGQPYASHEYDDQAAREADERVRQYAEAEAETRAMFGEDGADGE